MLGEEADAAADTGRLALPPLSARVWMAVDELLERDTGFSNKE